MSLRNLSCSLMMVMVLGTFGFVCAVQKESESEKLIKAARVLEEQPLEKQAKDIRRWAITWIVQTDKVMVSPCSLISNGTKKYKYESELFGQYTIGMAAFKLANPDKASDEDAAHLAGVESAILTYESILKTQPKAHNAFMDDLVSKRASATLAEYVKANNCRDKK